MLKITTVYKCTECGAITEDDVDDHVCPKNLEAVDNSVQQLKPKMPGVNIVETAVLNRMLDIQPYERRFVARVARETYEYLAEHFGH